MRIVKQNWFKKLGELHKEWAEAGVKASRATTHRCVKEFGYSCHQRRLTWAKEKNWTVAQWSKVLFSDESKFCISFGNQGPRVVRLAERISGSTLPSLQDIYLKRCKSRTAKIIKDSNHPGNHLFILLPSGRRYRSMLAKTERLRRSFFPQAIRLLNSVS